MNKMLTGILLLVAAFSSLGALAEEKPLHEGVEWNEIMVLNADKDDLPRVLLVGDSIVKGYFLGVQEHLSGTANCAKYTTSKFLGDPDYLSELEVLIKRYKFDVIHANNGLHGWGYTEKQYEESLLKFLQILKDRVKNATVVWAATTPVRRGNELSQFDETINNRVIERNRIATEIMKKHGIAVNDLYGLVKDHPEYYWKDGTHYIDEGKAQLAKKIANIIKEALSKNQDVDNVK